MRMLRSVVGATTMSACTEAPLLVVNTTQRVVDLAILEVVGATHATVVALQSVKNGRILSATPLATSEVGASTATIRSTVWLKGGGGRGPATGCPTRKQTAEPARAGTTIACTRAHLCRRWHVHFNLWLPIAATVRDTQTAQQIGCTAAQESRPPMNSRRPGSAIMFFTQSMHSHGKSLIDSRAARR